MAEARVGVIGGSGLYRMEGMEGVREVKPTTPFGEPSDALVTGTLEGVPVAFLPRHGRGHRLNPSEVPSRANIYALKELGVERVVSISAVGSLQEAIHPLEMVVPDQLIDRTRDRPATFFGNGLVAHVGMADPFCPELSALLGSAARQAGATVHPGGTYVVIEGPTFSTRAESALFRSWGASVIGMTALPEAKLAREAELCYATLACVTDYDVWHREHAPVSVEVVVANLQRNVSSAQQALRRLLRALPDRRSCPCGSALDNAIITAQRLVPAQTLERLRLLLGSRLG